MARLVASGHSRWSNRGRQIECGDDMASVLFERVHCADCSPSCSPCHAVPRDRNPSHTAASAAWSFTLPVAIPSSPRPQVNGPACQRSRQSSFLLTEDIQKNLFPDMCTSGKCLTILGNLECHVR